MCPYHLCTICVLIKTYCDTGCISTLSNTFRFIQGCAVLVTVFRNKTLESVVVVGERERKCLAVSPARHVKCRLCPAPSAVCLSWYIEHLFSSASKAKYSTLGERREMQVVSSFLLRVPSRCLEILVRLALRSDTRCCCRTFSLPPSPPPSAFDRRQHLHGKPRRRDFCRPLAVLLAIHWFLNHLTSGRIPSAHVHLWPDVKKKISTFIAS